MSNCSVEVYSRVCGFFRPIKDWNPGRKSEFVERKHFDKAVQETAKIKKFKDNPLAYG